MLGKQKVAVITGASRRIGPRLVRGFPEIGYGVVAKSRSMGATEVGCHQMILAVDGDVASPDMAERIVNITATIAERPAVSLSVPTRRVFSAPAGSSSE